MGIQEELLSNNPFVATAASNPWDNVAPDVSSLNITVRDRLTELAYSKALQPQTPMAALVLGDAGAGKTHMMKRVLAKIAQTAQAQGNQRKIVFSYVKAFTSPEWVFPDLWREIFINLTHELTCEGKNRTQFNVLVGQLMNDCRRYASLCGQPRLDAIDNIRYLQKEMPGLHGDFLRALFAYCDAFDEKKRMLSFGWLSGESDEEQHQLLGVEDRAEMSMGGRAREAKSLIFSLGLLLARYKTSMLLCFDQLDGMRSPALINAWGDAVAFLVNDVNCVLPLAFMRADTWYSIFEKTLDNAVAERFVTKFPLKNCTIPEAEELIRERVAAFFAQDARESIDKKSEWIIGQLDGKLKNGYSPRLVLDLANRAIQEEKPPLVVEVLVQAMNEERDRAANGPASSPDAERLLNAIELYLIHCQGLEKVERPANIGKFYVLTGDANGKQQAFIVDTEKHFKTKEAALRRGVQFLEKYPDGICAYITDERCQFKGVDAWPTVHAELEKFRRLGGNVFFLDGEQCANWYALAALRSRVENGDVTYLSNGGERNARMEDLALYLKEEFKDTIEAPSQTP
ncbi:hypothetical protein AGMMS50276_06300 [Synergistales bacterium]|nr:hypothetical protein AGMMS50276_06300 [Synergistales bacterium]